MSRVCLQQFSRLLAHAFFCTTKHALYLWLEVGIFEAQLNITGAGIRTEFSSAVLHYEINVEWQHCWYDLKNVLEGNKNVQSNKRALRAWSYLPSAHPGMMSDAVMMLSAGIADMDERHGDIFIFSKVMLAVSPCLIWTEPLFLTVLQWHGSENPEDALFSWALPAELLYTSSVRVSQN